MKNISEWKSFAGILTAVFAVMFSLSYARNSRATPATGDQTNVLLWTIILVGSAAVIAAIIVLMFRHRK